MSRHELKLMAKQDLKGNWTKPVILSTLFIILTLLIEASSTLIDPMIKNNIIGSTVYTIFSISLSAALSLGFYKFFFNIAKKEEYKLLDLFSCFKCIFKATILVIIIAIISALGLLLFVIPGIYFALGTSQSLLILAEDNSKTIFQCLSESLDLMKSHKIEYIILQLSYLGWILLGGLFFGIGLLLVTPYITLVDTYFYLYLKDSLYKQDNSSDKI